MRSSEEPTQLSGAALREQRATKKAVEQVESLILAQNERWRRA